LHGARMGRHVA